MKPLFPILSAVSWILYALVDFAKNALETYYHVLLMNGIGNFTNQDYGIDAGVCQGVLLAVGIFCLAASVVPLFVKKKE